MTISSPDRESKKVKIAVDRNPVETSFEKWACDLKQRFCISYGSAISTLFQETCNTFLDCLYPLQLMGGYQISDWQLPDLFV